MLGDRSATSLVMDDLASGWSMADYFDHQSEIDEQVEAERASAG